MLIFPNAKINIGLNIIGKRSDGYHDLRSVFYPVGLSDALEIADADSREEIIFTSSGIDIPGPAGSNLCEKAYHLIKRDYVLPKVRVHLHKHIPIGAGLGGGSSDAAYFMKLMNEKYELGISWGELHNYARQLGSDCSFFVTNRPAYAEGRGDEFESIPLDLSEYCIVIIHPHIHISTAEAYAGVSPKMPARTLETDVTNIHIEEWKDCVHNDFEESIFARYPAVSKVKSGLYELGAIYASMSGSGSAVYGIFDSAPDARRLEAAFPSYFRWTGTMGNNARR